jgi:hypothetical protein
LEKYVLVESEWSKRSNERYHRIDERNFGTVNNPRENARMAIAIYAFHGEAKRARERSVEADIVTSARAQ